MVQVVICSPSLPVVSRQIGFDHNVSTSLKERRRNTVFFFFGSGVTSLDLVDECAVERHLLTKGLPDPDLLIRTSGEKRVSQFFVRGSVAGVGL